MPRLLNLILGLFIAALILPACNVAKRQMARMEVYAVRYPDKFKVLANTLDPCYTGGSKSDTVTITGKPDTITITSPPIFIKGQPGQPDTIKIPGKTTTIKTPIYTTIHDTITNNRAVESAKAELKMTADSLIIVKTNLKTTDHSKHTWMWIAIGCISLIVIFIVVKVYSFISGGAIASAIKKVS